MAALPGAPSTLSPFCSQARAASPKLPFGQRNILVSRKDCRAAAQECSDAQTRVSAPELSIGRRDLFLGVSTAAAGAILGGTLLAPPALAWRSYRDAPEGFKVHRDRYEGYSLFIPESWEQVQVAGSEQDCCFQDPSSPGEHISIRVMPYATSRFIDMTDLGSPEEAGQQLLKQMRQELRDSKQGVRREPKLMRADARTSYDGDYYYEIEVNVRTYSDGAESTLTTQERREGREGDICFLTVLGVANRRLYQLRAQVPSNILEAESPKLRQILNSFQAFEVPSA